MVAIWSTGAKSCLITLIDLLNWFGAGMTERQTANEIETKSSTPPGPSAHRRVDETIYAPRLAQSIPWAHC